MIFCLLCSARNCDVCKKPRALVRTNSGTVEHVTCGTSLLSTERKICEICKKRTYHWADWAGGEYLIESSKRVFD